MPQNRVRYELIHHLSRQYPTGISTWSQCNKCHQAARGGYLCTTCLTAELTAECGKPELVAALINNYEIVQSALFARERIVDQIMEAP